MKTDPEPGWYRIVPSDRHPNSFLAFSWGCRIGPRTDPRKSRFSLPGFEIVDKLTPSIIEYHMVL